MVQPMSLFEATLRGGVVALLLVLAVLIARDLRRSAVDRYGAFFAVCVVAYLVESAPVFAARNDAWLWPLRLLSTANPAVFWLWVKAEIDDPFVPSWRNWLPWLGMLGLGAYAMADDRALSWHLVRVASLLLVGLAVWRALAERSGDLVEGRRRLRLMLAVGAALYTAVVEFIWFVIPGGTHGLGTTVGLEIVLAALVAFALALRVTRPTAAAAAIAATPAAPVARATAAAPSIPDPEEARLLDALRRAMEVEKAYREEECSVGTLAGRLSIPEYRLRRLINQRLGYRNFTTYVNGYRLAETTSALADPSQARVPILTIALDAGFRSLGPFNRAFKAHTGVTPSEYRRMQVGAASDVLSAGPPPTASPIPKSASG